VITISQRKKNLLERLRMVQLREIAKKENIKSASKKSVLVKRIIDSVDEKKIEEYFSEYSQMGKFDIRKHVLVPKFRRINEDEINKLLKKLKITRVELPKISVADPMSVSLAADIGDVIEITRKSPTAGESKYYRVVSSE